MEIKEYFDELNKIITEQGLDDVIRVDLNTGNLIFAHPNINKTNKEQVVDFIHRYINNGYDELSDLIVDTTLGELLKQFDSKKGKEIFLEYLVNNNIPSYDSFIKFLQEYLTRDDNKDNDPMKGLTSNIAYISLDKLIDEKYDKYVADIDKELKTDKIDSLKNAARHRFATGFYSNRIKNLTEMFAQKLDLIEEASERATIGYEDMQPIIMDEIYYIHNGEKGISKVFENPKVQRRIENLFNRLKKSKYTPEDLFRLEFADGIDSYTIDLAKKSLDNFCKQHPQNVQDMAYCKKILKAKEFVFDERGLYLPNKEVNHEEMEQMAREIHEQNIADGLLDEEIFGPHRNKF